MHVLYAQNESEPNNDLPRATPIEVAQEVMGGIGKDGDRYDYYKTLLPASGSVVVHLEGTHTGGSVGSVALYAYDKSGRQIGVNSLLDVAVSEGETIRDSLHITSLALDSVYFLVYQGGNRSFDYRIRYEMADVYDDDDEPNGGFQQAADLPVEQSVQGLIGYRGDGVIDRYDYLKTELPRGGTVKVYVSGVHTGGSDGSLSFYAYDKSHRQIATKAVLGEVVAAGGAIRDTIEIVSRAADSIYFLVYQGGNRSFSYTISYEMVDEHPDDEEPNGTFDGAVAIVENQVRVGTIGYVTNGNTDRYDYYRTQLPDNGTVSVKLEALHTGGSNGTVALYVYDKSGRQIGVKQIGDGGTKRGDNVQGVLDITSRSQANETIYFLVYQGGSRSFAYQLSYEVGDLNEADPEPNGTFSQAGGINAGESLAGLIGYVANGVTDRYDYYKTLLPASGTINVYLAGTHTGGSAGTFTFYAYDKSGRQIATQQVAGGSVNEGDSVLDTVQIVSRDADSVYFLIYEGSSRSFSYELSYEVLDQHYREAEPNDGFPQAIIVNEGDSIRGQIGYVANGATDRNDYYKTGLPDDGTVKIYIEGLHTGGSDGSFSFYAYDKSRRQIATKSALGESVSKGGVVHDTIEIHSRAADTLYFQVYQGANRSFAYEMRYEVVDRSANDLGPNDVFQQAADLLENEAANGHIGYVADGVTDRYDYYQTPVPEDGTVKIYLEGLHTGGSTGSFTFYAYDKSNRQLVTRTVGESSVTLGDQVRDTIEIYSRAADTLYFLVYQGSNRSFAYKIRYEVVDKGANDWEPNNTFDEATTVTVADRVEGHIGYVADGVTDRYDYYVLEVPSNGNIDLYVAGLNTGGGEAGFHIYAYDKRRRQVASQRVGDGNVGKGGILRDTISLACVQTDSLYVLVYQGGTGSFQYDIGMKHIDRQPHAAFEFERVGNEIGFRAAEGNADEYLWDFGDGTTATGRFPMKVFGFGSYTARLIAVNSVCGLTDTTEYAFEFKGVEYFTPTSVGKGGDGIIQVFGGGLTENTVVTLSKGGNTLQPDGVYASAKGTSMTATFDLHFAEEGEYDVTILIPGEEPLVYPKAFTIGSFNYPTTWSEVTGPDEWRVGRETRFNLVVGNRGNVTASGVMVALLWPKSVSLQMEHREIKPDPDGTTTVVDDDGEVHTLSNEYINYIYENEDTATEIDMFQGKPYNGYIRLLMIPHVPAGGTFELPFTVRATSAATQKFITFTLKPNYFGSCNTPNYADLSNNVASEMIDLVDMAADKTKNVPLQALTKTLKVGQKHLAVNAKLAGAKFWAWYDDYEVPAETYSDIWKDLDAANEYAMWTATEELGKMALGKGVDKLKADNAAWRKETRDFINGKFKDPSQLTPKQWQKYQDGLNSLLESSGRDARLELLMDVFDKADKFKTLEDKRRAFLKALEDCPELAEQMEDLLDELGDELLPKDEREKETNSIGSMDPNAIYGPAGVGSARYVNKLDRQSFLITFENVDTATAAAQVVRVLDTLDREVFDLSSFEFGNVTIGNDTYRVPKNRKEFVLDVPPAAARSLRVRINASLDTVSGVIEWQFFSVDPQTGDLPVLDGFLPPNVKYPEGEGSISYSISLRSDIGNNVLVSNRASIIFDDNEPILTNQWQNRTDLMKPASQVHAEVKADSVIHLRISGSDDGSGLGYHRIYYNENETGWYPLTGTRLDTLSIVGQPGGTYSFYAVSGDKVGNLEEKVPDAEATVTIAGMSEQPERAQRPFVLAPNPTSTGTPSIISANYTGKVTVRVANVLGQEVVRPIRLEMSAGMGTPIDLSRLGSGMYFLVIQQEDGKVYRDKLIIHKP
ncbi:T9SS type A sorting domain-containing protein [Parapedobacter sp. 2B3]